jgi:hypothetical protein
VASAVGLKTSSIWSGRTAVSVFALALAARLILLFFVAGPENTDWYLDSYHHWQIAYFTLKIGISQGRLWDLGGLEYFWGALPPLAQAGVMALSNTASIIPYRIANSIFGNVSPICCSSMYYGVQAGVRGWSIRFLNWAAHHASPFGP